MDGKQKGFTLIEILVVVTIIGVLAGLVVVLIPKGQFEAQKTQCMNNVRNLTQLMVAAPNYPPYSGANLALYWVNKRDIVGEDKLKGLFCPGDTVDTWVLSGGVDAYKDIDLSKNDYDKLTSYAGRAMTDRNCAAKKGEMESRILFCDDKQGNHNDKGFVVGFNDASVKWRDKVDDWKLSITTVVEIGEGSVVEELQCMRP